MKSNTPGLDSIPFTVIKGLNDDNLKLLRNKFRECIKEKNIPEDWKKGWVKLLPKREVKQLGDIRPITILPIYYRILFNIIAFKLRKWAAKNINYRQQAFITGRNTANHGLLLSALAMKHNESFILVNLDIEGAYDSVERSVIEMALKHCKFPEPLIEFILNAYDNQILQLEVGFKLSKPINKTRGIPQGCPLAPLVYDCITQLIIDKCIDKWKLPITPKTLDINKIGLVSFADDINFMANRYCKFNSRLANLNQWLNQLALKINPKKSVAAILPKTSKLKPEIDSVPIPIEDNVRVLGHYPWNDRISNSDIDKRIDTIKLALRHLPLQRMEMTNIRRVIQAKVLGLFTHLMKTNMIPDKKYSRIDTAVRNAIRRKGNLHNATPTMWFHLGLDQGGLNIPSIEDYGDISKIRTLMYLSNHPQELMREVITYGMNNSRESDNNIFSEIKRVMKKFSLGVFKGNENDLNLEQVDGQTFTIYTDGSKINDNTGFGITINNHTTKRSFPFKIDGKYSNNVAEIASIITAMKMIPERSKATIYSDSTVAIEILTKKSYNGMFNGFNKEFHKLIKHKSLDVTIQKVKGHKDAGNIEVDQIAKEGTINGKWLDIKDLFTQEQSFIENDRLLLFDYKEFMQREQTKRRNEIASHKSNLDFTNG